MQNEERILTMLDFIAAELKDLKETSATKDELRSFREQTYDRFDKNEARMISLEDRMTSMEGKMTSMEGKMTFMEGKMTSMEGKMTSMEGRMTSMEGKMTSMEGKVTSIEENMVTKDDFLASKRENQVAHESIQAKMDEQGELIEARFDVLNDRLFDQETQLQILKRRDVI